MTIKAAFVIVFVFVLSSLTTYSYADTLINGRFTAQGAFITSHRNQDQRSKGSQEHNRHDHKDDSKFSHKDHHQKRFDHQHHHRAVNHHNYYVYYTYLPAPTAVSVGSFVTILPEDYQTFILHNQKYYYSDGIYYIEMFQGYQVVAQPLFEDDVSFPVNIPTEQGGYAQVVLKKSGQGFIGPQGEFYPEFPKVAQLKAMYL